MHTIVFRRNRHPILLDVALRRKAWNSGAADFLVWTG